MPQLFDIDYLRTGIQIYSRRKLFTEKTVTQNMRVPTRWEQPILDVLTRLWVWFYYRSTIERQTVRSWSGEQEVYWFSSEANLRGQTIPIGTIILNEQKLSGCSDEELRYVVEHEVGHTVRNSVGRGLFYGLVLFWIPLGGLLLVKALGYSLLIPFGLPFEPVLQSVGVSLFMIGSGFAAIRVEEILADFHVLNYVSYKDYLAAYNEMEDGEERTLLSNIHQKLIYTRPETIVRLHRAFERTRNSMFVI